MTFDIHAHLFGANRRLGNTLSVGRIRSFAVRRTLQRLGVQPSRNVDEYFDELVKTRTLEWIEESHVDRVVLLALDWVHRSDGSRDEGRTVAATANDYVAAAARSSDKTLFGASVHPYRRDALAELARVVELGACLIKWIPSAQLIRPDHPACFPFYEALAQSGVPLLCHTGVEHVLSGAANTLNDPRRLCPALERGVTVIAAHLGAPMTLYEPGYVRCWIRMAGRFQRLYGDISALAVPLRAAILRWVARQRSVSSRLLYGSDYPHCAWPLAILPHLGPRKAIRLARIRNPIDKSYVTTRSLGLPHSVFTRAEEVLKIA